MKKIIYIACAAAALAAVSCAKTIEFDSTEPAQAPGLTIRFTTGDMTRATTVDGVDNENLIKKIDYFIFPYNVDDEGNMVGTTEYVYKGELVPTEQAPDGKYSTTIAPGKLSEIFPDGATKAVVFAVANYVDKFGAAVESPNTTIPETAKTWEALHALEIGETFFKDGGPGFGLRWPRVMQPSPYNVQQTKVDDAGNPVLDDNENEVIETVEKTDDLFFVMTGEAEITLSTSGSYAVDAEIPLKRLASKVTVNFTYEPVVEEKTSGNIYWVPQPGDEETRVYLSNAIEHTTLGGPLDQTKHSLVADSWETATKPLGDGTRDIFEYSYDYMNDIAEVGGKKTAHYYTYPIQMEEGDDNQTYLKLVLPWYGYKWVGEGTAPKTVDPTSTSWQMYKQKEVYYKIVLPSSSINEGNRIYEFSVTVNIIGSDKEVKIIGEEYVVKDWITKAEVSSNVATGRFISLDIPKDEYDMYVDELDITFVSSGKVIPIVEEIYQWNYSNATPTKDYFMQNNAVPASASTGGQNSLLNRKGITAAQILNWVTIPENSSYLKINHEMDNQLMNDAGTGRNPAFDMAPYVFRVRLHLEAAGTDTSFDRTVTITQYPSLYVENRRSAGYVFINEYSNDGKYTYTQGGGWNTVTHTNPCYDDRGENYNYHLGNIPYGRESLNGTGDNDNPNNYIITVSILPESENDIIGDPRDPEVNNLSNLGGLTNYHPSLRTGTRYVIAPKFIVASSYSALTSGSPDYTVNLATAEKRCAAYQENGYPAGRWRVPTAAEILFLAKLSKYEFIPSLFNFTSNSAGYWSANGKVNGSGSGEPSLNTNDTTSGGGIRCVYDAWYWGEEPYQEGATTWLGFQDK